MSFLLLQRFSHMSYQETIIIICCIIFSLFFPTGFKGVLATYLLYSPHIFSTGFLGETLKIIWKISQDGRSICKKLSTMKHSRSGVVQGGVLEINQQINSRDMSNPNSRVSSLSIANRHLFWRDASEQTPLLRTSSRCIYT